MDKVQKLGDSENKGNQRELRQIFKILKNSTHMRPSTCGQSQSQSQSHITTDGQSVIMSRLYMCYDNVAKHTEFYLGYLRFNLTSTGNVGVSKRALQL
jgi:hypothetical protein